MTLTQKESESERELNAFRWKPNPKWGTRFKSVCFEEWESKKSRDIKMHLKIMERKKLS